MQKASFDTVQCAQLSEKWRNECRTAAEGMKSDPEIMAASGPIRLGFNISGGATIYLTLETEAIRCNTEDALAEALYLEILQAASPKH